MHFGRLQAPSLLMGQAVDGQRRKAGLLYRHRLTECDARSAGQQFSGVMNFSLTYHGTLTQS
jgi:hypothetical protein